MTETAPLPDTAADADWARQQQQRLGEQHAMLQARFDAGEPVDALLQARTRQVDATVRAAWRRCLPDDGGMALLALGGYGRCELFPQSDIDLLVLADVPAQLQQADALARFVSLLWDAGLRASQAVRSLAQTVTAAEDDITVFTALLDARALQATAAALDDLRHAVGPVWPAEAFFRAKRGELRERHARFDDTADNLEPNLKEGPGGLRDLQTLRWMAMRLLDVPDLAGLVALGQLGEDEFASLERERQALSRLRWGLHGVVGRAEERLRFDHQKRLAERLGFVDRPGSLAVEQMMQGFYRSAALVLRIGERLLQRFDESMSAQERILPLDDTFLLRNGYLAASDPAWPRSDVATIFDLFASWAAQPQVQGLHSRTARALAEALPCIPAYADAPVPLRQRFIALLRGPQPVQTLERMARLGVLARWLPAFAQVSGRMQFDLFHVYTVDQHTLAVLRHLQGFSTGEADPRFSIAHTVWPQLRKPDTLLLAALFHDIGKGRGGDHSELGAVDAAQFCHAHGLSQGDGDLVTWLVRHHLLMSTVAQKQDIADPEVIHRFAGQVADRNRLDHLYLLTCADIAGTSPKLWNGWKDQLLAELYAATRLALRRGLEHPVAAAERIADTRALAREMLLAHGADAERADAVFARMPEDSFLRGRPDQVAWQAGVLADQADQPIRVALRDVSHEAGQTLEAFVQSPDRDGLFAAIVATLDRAGLAIQQARLLRGPAGDVFDTFLLLPLDASRRIDPQAVAGQLQQVLQRADLDGVRPVRRTQPRNLKHFRIPTRIDFLPTSDGRRTLLSLVCTDRPGLLADVARVLRTARMRVHDARIATFGEKAEDMFQITTETDQPLVQNQCQALDLALRAQIEGDPSP